MPAGQPATEQVAVAPPSTAMARERMDRQESREMARAKALRDCSRKGARHAKMARFDFLSRMDSEDRAYA